MLSIGRPCRYTGIARYYRIRKETGDRSRQAGPLRAIEKIKLPLANYQKASRGEPIDCYEWQEEYYKDIVKFWQYWLREVWAAVHLGRLDEFGEPISQLRRLLQDLSEGSATQLTGRFPIKAARKGRGRREDAAPVIRHKLTLALCYRILTAVCFRKQQNALWKLKLILVRLGYEKKPKKMDVLNSPIPDYARKFLSEKYIKKSGIIPRYFVLDSLIRDFMLNFYNQLSYDHLVTDKVKEIFQHLYRRETEWAEKEWAEQVAEFQRAIAAICEPSVKWRFFRAWLLAEKVSCSVMLRLMSDRSELRRLGLAT